MRTLVNSFSLAVLLTGVFVANESAKGWDKPGPATAPSVPFSCALKRGTWCIRQGSVEVTKLQRVGESDPPGSAWRLNDVHYPSSTLIVLEPAGCTHAFADTVEARGIEYGVDWDGRKWDRMTVRIRTDGSCDLRLLVTPFHDEPSEWAFFAGRTFIEACKDDDCLDPLVPTPGDVTNQYRDGFRRAGR